MLEKMKKIGQSFFCAYRGLVYVIKKERNFQIELFCAYWVLALAIWFRINSREIVVLLLTIGLVLSLEIINTAMERVVNILKPGLHPWARVVKDLLAAAVLLACSAATIIGILIFWPYIFY